MSERRGEWHARIQKAVSETESPVIEHYKPKFLDLGGEHLVFEIPGRDSVVVKVNFQSLEKVLDYAHEHQIAPDHLPEDMIQGVKDHIAHATRCRQELDVYFKGHIPQERDVIGNLPITPAILTEVFGDDHPAVREYPLEVPAEATVLMRIQEKLPPEAFNDEGYSFNFRYQEGVADMDPDAYEKLSRALIHDAVDEDSKTLFHETLHPGMQDLFARAAEDEGLRVQVVDFVRRAVKYTNETGDILDLAGDRNVILFQKDENYTYLLPDAAYWDGRGSMREVIIQHLTEGVEGSNPVMNALNYTKLLNGCALLLSMPERVTLFEGMQIDFKKFLADCQVKGVK